MDPSALQTIDLIERARAAQTQARPLYGISDIITVAIAPSPPQDLQPGDQYRVLFITDGERDATSADIADYDAFVRSELDRNPALELLSSSWFAVASTPTVDARTHTGTNGSGGVPIYRPDGVRLADDYDHLWSVTAAQPLHAPVNIMGSGGVTSRLQVWTGTDRLGMQSTPLGVAGGLPTLGRPATTGPTWIDQGSKNPAIGLPFYAISAVLSVPYPATIGTSCGPATLSRDTLPMLGASFDCTLSGVPSPGVGVLLLDIAVPTGTPLPAPPFAAGCVLYVGGTAVTVSVINQPSQSFAIPIPNQPAFVGIPITMQGAAVDTTTNEVSFTNAIAARIRDI